MTNTESETAQAAPMSTASRVLVMLALGLTSAVLVGITVEQVGLIFDVDPALIAELEASTTPNPSPALMEKIRLSGLRAERLDTAIFFAAFGMISAAALAAGAVITGVKRGRMVSAVAVGIIVGGVLGAAGGFVGESIAQEIEVHEMDELFRSMAVHAPAFALIGLAAGLAAGGVTGAVLGCVAGLITVPVCVFGGMMVFPQEQTLRSLPQQSFHFTAWCVIAMGLCALALGRGLNAPQAAGPVSSEAG